MSKIAPTIKELIAQRKPVRNVNILHRETFTGLEKIALYITEKVGTMGFFFLVSIWTIAWLSWNTFAPVALRFDAFPAFVLWLFISNVLQLLFLPLIMVGQNLQGRHAEARAQNDFEINVKAEREIEAILLHLEKQGEQVERILNHLENKL
jgi:uncharacterized membrane protein